LGAIAMCGRAFNVWDDIKNPWTPPDTATKLTTALTATPATIEVTSGTAGTANTTVLTANWSKSVSWTMYFHGRTTGATYQTQATSSSLVSLSWTSKKRDLTSAAFGAEVVDVRVKVAGMDTTKGSDFKTTITLTPSTSVLPRATVAPFVKGGVVLQDHLWNSGDQIRARVMDLSGRQVQTASVATLEPAGNGVVLSLSLPRALSVRILEVTDLEGTRASRYLISPNP